MKKNFSFNNKGSYSNYRKILPNLNIKIKSLPKLHKRQIEFGTPKPVREYQRFLSFRKSLSGIDPYEKYKSFIKKDLIKPMERPSLYDKFNIKSPRYIHNDYDSQNSKKNKETKWSLGTIARAPDEDRLPKKQQFKIYYFPPEYNNKDPEKYRNYSLKSDCIGLKIPKIEKVNSEKSFLKLKNYSSNNETKLENQWVPKATGNSINNISSKNYNIINFLPLETSRNNNSHLLNKSLNFRKKGMGEFYDLTNVYNTNSNKEYLKKFKENPKRFYKFTGIFSNIYDASNRNGKITLPFDLKQN